MSSLYGELYGLYLALLIAKKDKENVFKYIAGDNISAIECSLEKYKEKKFENFEMDLINAIINLRKELAYKCEIYYVTGDTNPADLGFHR